MTRQKSNEKELLKFKNMYYQSKNLTWEAKSNYTKK